MKNKLILPTWQKEKIDVVMKKFTKKVLMERLDFTEDEAKLIVKAQAQFPELLTLDESENEFIISSRKLHEQLEVGRDYSTWVKGRISKYNFVENVDFVVIWNDTKTGVVVEYNGNSNSMVKLGYTIDYIFTLERGKELCMVENNDNGTLCRRYFILMEKAVKKMSDWLLIRNPQKQGYKDMSKAVRYNYMQLHNGEEPNQFIYINNADMVNLALLGHKSKAMKELLEVQYDDALRDHVTLEVNKALYELQQLNENLLYSNVDFKTRKMIIETTVRTKYTGLRIRFTSEFAKELSLIRD